MKLNPKAKKTLIYTGRAGIIVLTLLLALVIALYSVMLVLAKGPSPTARDLFVRSVMETSAAKFLARMYFTEDEIAAIMGQGGDGVSDDNLTDSGMIHIPGNDDKTNETLPFSEATDNVPQSGADSDPSTPPDTDTPIEDVPGVEIVDVEGSTFRGKMMIIHDPKRVEVATLPNYGQGYKGKTLRNFISDMGAVGGINAGGFEDDNGQGTGAIPDGIVIRDGKIIWGSADKTYKCVVGFDKNHILHVGNMTGKQALAAGIIDGLSFSLGPVLVKNGVPGNANHKLGGGLNPRTAIGQRADGAILLLVINGRQAGSLGATCDDVANVMVSFGAVNAANLDGGSSSLMMYEGEAVTQSAYLFGERKLPNAFVVLPER